MRTLNIPVPKLDNQEVSLLTQAATTGNTTINVQNTSGFSAGDKILIGYYCAKNDCVFERSEIVDIISVDSETQLTISALKFDHDYDDAVVKLMYDKLLIFKSGDNVNYSQIADISIDYSKTFIVYNDAGGTNDDYYRYQYYNSVTSEASDFYYIPRIAPEVGYITLDEFKKTTGICVDDVLIREAIAYGANNIRRELYFRNTYKSGVKTNKHVLKRTPFMTLSDANLDGKPIDKNDVYAYELINGNPPQVIDITNDIVSVDPQTYTVEFNQPKPQNPNAIVVIEYHETSEKLRFTDSAYDSAGSIRWFNIHLKQLNKLWAVNYIFENLPVQKLKKGISEWSLGGVNVRFDHEGIRSIIEDNEKRINTILTKLEVPYVRFTTTQNTIPSRWTSQFLSSINWNR